jgi:GT2 family glycosyltransferase
MHNRTKRTHISAAKPDISVVIINKNERDVDVTLQLLAKQQLSQSYETIVVDASAGALDDIYDAYPQLRRINFVSKSSKKVTIPEQRNEGIRAAQGAIIVFIDASCEPGPDWLAILTEPLRTHDERMVAGGTLSTGQETFHDTVYTTQKQQKYIDQAPTINLAIARDVFAEIGYFDENLRYGSDMDFTWRARAAGIQIRNIPSALVTHDWGTLKTELKRADHYGQAKIILYRKHRYGLLNFARREFALCFYLGFFIGLPLTIWFPFYPLLLVLPMLKNLRASPFKLVAINVVTAYGAAKELVRP